MKVQMVIVANAREERGRSLVGIRLQDGQLMMRSGKPHWLRPVIQRCKTSIPTPMVVDLMPLDVIEIELRDGERLDHPDGYVEADFYRLQIKGRLPLDQLVGCCSLPAMPAISPENDDLAHPEGLLGKAICMIVACQCTVITPMQDIHREQIVLQFGFCGMIFQFPVADPWFLEHIAITSESVVCLRSVQIVLSPCRRRNGKAQDFRVLSVLL
jgi:hypothetical protein